MNGEVVGFHPKAKWFDIESAQFHAAARHSFKSRHKPAMNHVTEGIGMKIGRERYYENNKAGKGSDQQSSEPLRLRLLSIHLPPPPRPVGVEGTRISLSNRRVRIQTAKRSFIFSWARSSRIFGATCSSGTSAAPLWRKSGRSLSR